MQPSIAFIPFIPGALCHGLKVVALIDVLESDDHRRAGASFYQLDAAVEYCAFSDIVLLEGLRPGVPGVAEL